MKRWRVALPRTRRVPTTASGFTATRPFHFSTGKQRSSHWIQRVADQENSTVVGQWNLEGQAGVLFAGERGGCRQPQRCASSGQPWQPDRERERGGQWPRSAQLIATLQAQVDSLTQQLQHLAATKLAQVRADADVLGFGEELKRIVLLATQT